MTDQAVWEMQWPMLENLVDGSNSCFRMERDFCQSRVGGIHGVITAGRLLDFSTCDLAGRLETPKYISLILSSASDCLTYVCVHCG
jgi:hypothetical protein